MQKKVDDFDKTCLYSSHITEKAAGSPLNKTSRASDNSAVMKPSPEKKKGQANRSLIYQTLHIHSAMSNAGYAQ